MINSSQLDEIKQLLILRTGLHISQNSLDQFDNLLNERKKVLGFVTLTEYQTFLAGNKSSEEWEEIVRAMSSHETFFFRDQGQFDLLRLNLLPELIARNSSKKTLRIWSAGCSSGEEAYSLAILLDMLLPQRSDWKILILGTDIDSKAIAKARIGRYLPWSFRMVPVSIQQHFFNAVANEWELDARIRSMVTFRVGNLVSDEFPDSAADLHDMDLILCRNVFIYFDRAAIAAVAAKFALILAEDGYLMTAHTELMGYPVDGLESRLFQAGMVYQRQANFSAGVISPAVQFIEAERGAIPVKPHRFHVDKVQCKETQVLPHNIISPVAKLSADARAFADQGEYDLAERMCHDALAADPLAVVPYFLLAQLSEIKEDFNLAKEYLNKVIYINHRYIAAYMELAALYEREGNMLQVRSLQHIVLGMVLDMPGDEQIENYESTAGELAQWLGQLEVLAKKDRAHNKGTQHG